LSARHHSWKKIWLLHLHVTGWRVPPPIPSTERPTGPAHACASSASLTCCPPKCATISCEFSTHTELLHAAPKSSPNPAPPVGRVPDPAGRTTTKSENGKGRVVAGIPLTKSENSRVRPVATMGRALVHDGTRVQVSGVVGMVVRPAPKEMAHGSDHCASPPGPRFFRNTTPFPALKERNIPTCKAQGSGFRI
jgi:hypothetical protein